MKNLHLLLAACALALAGCSTLEKGLKDQSALVQAILSANFPDDFTGPAELHIQDMYNRLDVVGAGLKKNADTGHWTWTYVKIDNVLTIPWFSGLTYTREVHVVEGSPSASVSPNQPTSTVGTVTSERPTTLIAPGTVTTTVTTAPAK